MMTNETDLISLVCRSYDRSVLKKLIFSQPKDKQNAEVLKVSGRLVEHRGQKMLAMEYTLRGDTVAQRNLRCEKEIREVTGRLEEQFDQINLLTTLCDSEWRITKGGKAVALGADKLARKLASDSDLPDEAMLAFDRLEREKKHILTGEEDFCIRLGISDRNGKVHDKKQGKFRQINRFCEYVDDIYDKLSTEGTLRIYDLCCGKSYLSFAVYYYLTVCKKREVEMLCMDLKEDVIRFCEGEASALGYSGMHFEVGDIGRANLKRAPDLVISLHACDIATDIVLNTAAKLDSKVILSTPCCHRNMRENIHSTDLAFVTDYPQLSGKLCDALTDALRLLKLQSAGYEVTATELVDPEDTPKNTLLRAVKRKKDDPAAKDKYKKALAFLFGDQADAYLQKAGIGESWD